MYLGLKAVHVIAVIAWMAAILYLYRLLVYQAEEPEALVRERLQVWQRKLIRAIGNPAMVVVWVTGPTLAWMSRFYLQPWLQIKVVLVVAMTGMYHHALRVRKRLASDPQAYRGRTLRILNEVPTLLMMAIVVLAVVKPF